MSSTQIIKGKILIAEPSIINDSSFNRSVILLTEHNKEGSVGFIINKPTEYLLSDIIPSISSNHIIYNGGPVSDDNLYFIHRIPKLIPNSISISEGNYWAGDFESVKELLISKKITKNDIRFFLGYTGWSNKQLGSELKETSWLLKENSYSNILKVTPNSFWRNEIIKAGGKYQIWANSPENPALN